MNNWPHCFGPGAVQNIMVGVCDRRSSFTSWMHMKQKEKESRVPQSPLEVHFSGTLNLLCGPTSQEHHGLGAQPLTYGPFMDISGPNYSTF
jgi:hypothetical protein